MRVRGGCVRVCACVRVCVYSSAAITIIIRVEILL